MNHLLLAFTLVLGINSAAAESVTKIYPRKDNDLPPFNMSIEGYGQFKFGMSLEEAKSEIIPITFGLTEEGEVNLPSDEFYRCGDPKRACGMFPGFFGYDELVGELTASDGEYIDRITLFFRYKSPGNKNIVSDLGITDDEWTYLPSRRLIDLIERHIINPYEESETTQYAMNALEKVISGNESCAETVQNVLKSLGDKYKLPTEIVTTYGMGYFWKSDSGGSIQFDPGCLHWNLGVIRVVFTGQDYDP